MFAPGFMNSVYGNSYKKTFFLSKSNVKLWSYWR